MKQEIAARWASALESGAYKQAKGALRTADGFCCLGVLCDLLAVPHAWDNTHTPTQNGRFVFGADKNPDLLPTEVVEAVGMADNSGMPEAATGNGADKVAIGGREYDSLAEANDGGESFQAIANWIRTNWSQL